MSMTTDPTVTIPLALLERAIETCKGLLLQVLQETDGLSEWTEQDKQLIADLEAVKAKDVVPIVKQVCDECNGLKFLSEQDYWDNGHCNKCEGKGFISAREGQKE